MEPLTPQSFGSHPGRLWYRRAGRIGIFLCGAFSLALLISLGMSFISTTDLQDFQKNLENGDLKSPVSSGNPALFLQVDWRRGGAEKFEEAVESYNGRLEPLKERYPAAVEYLAYNPKSAEIMSMVAR